MVGAVTKATVGFAVDRAAATVSEEQGLPPPSRSTSQQDSAGAKRKALAGLLSNFVAFLKADGPMESPSARGRQVGGSGCGSDAAVPRGTAVGRIPPVLVCGERCERLRPTGLWIRERDTPLFGWSLRRTTAVAYHHYHHWVCGAYYLAFC